MNDLGVVKQASVHEGRGNGWGGNSIVSKDDPIERTVEDLRKVSRSAALEFAIQIGTIIIDRFYNGDAEQWRNRGTKHASFRKLAAHPMLPLSPGALYRAVAICELTRRFSGRRSVMHLGCSHLRAVLGLSVDEQCRLLDEAYESQWTVDRLTCEAAMVRPQPRKGGRRPTAPVVRAVRAVQRCVENELVRVLDKLDPGLDFERAAHLVESVRKACRELEMLIDERGCV